ncbi:MAG TPA: hypothetical protein VMS98_08290 [Thermoanaerobaculia bacterium]|nr:hypothetical protein [Thermoanaerobaculia bacterium]
MVRIRDFSWALIRIERRPPVELTEMIPITAGRDRGVILDD